MGFNPDNYNLKKLSEYPEILFGTNLPDGAFMPVVSLDENDALANYKISLTQLRDFIIQNGDYTNVIDYRPENYALISEKQLTIPAGWRLEVPNGFLPTGEYQNSIVNITEDRVIDFSQQQVGKYSVVCTADNNYVLLQSALLVRKNRSVVISPATGTIVYETDNNLWWRYTGSDWQQIPGMPLLNVEVSETGITVALCNSLIRNRLNLQYLLAQAGIEIPESRGPFERIITNVKKSGADLLYYIPAGTEVDLQNYPDTLDLIQGAYARAVAAGAKTQTIIADNMTFYYDAETGLYFAPMASYMLYLNSRGYAPVIGYDGTGTVIKTPISAHGELVAEWQTGNAPYFSHVKVFADGWVEQQGSVFLSQSAEANVKLLVAMRDVGFYVNANTQDQTDGAAVSRSTAIINASTISLRIGYSSNLTRRCAWTVKGYADPAALTNIINAYSRFEYYLLGNSAKNIPVDLAGQLGTILNAYNQIVQNGADFFSIQATDENDAVAKSAQNPTKFVYVADS